jgi:hypothetical protein
MIQPVIQAMLVCLKGTPHRVRQRLIVDHIVDPLYIALCQRKDDFIRISDYRTDCVNSVHFLLDFFLAGQLFI